jgi:dihydroxyacetone kinase
VFGAAAAEDAVAPKPSTAGAAAATLVGAGLRELQRTVHANEQELGRIDAVAGDGDHGRGMVKGADASITAIDALGGTGPAWLLRAAGRAWAAGAGGTSGVLWGAGLEAAGEALTDTRDAYDASSATDAVAAFTDAIIDLGRAEPGDKTLVDALLPFRDALTERIADGDPLVEAWRTAAASAVAAAEATAGLSPKKGRARPLAEKSVGTPDAGATSLSLIVTALGALTPAAE